ncbi:MAG: capsule assembly Wzi family protein [Bacteroidales bacterium]
MKLKSLLLILLISCVGLANGQKKVKYEVGLSTSVGTESEVPFWLQSNKRGLVPNKSYVMGDFSLGMDFNKEKTQGIDFMWEASAAAYTGDDTKFIIDNLYTGFKWKMFRFYLGQKADAIAFDGLSSTNGNILYANNARSYPKYEISVPNWTDVPFLEGIVSFKGMLSDGITMDNRYIDNALIHRKNLFVRLFKDAKFSVSGGLEHVAMWSGDHPEHGKISMSLNKYWKVFTGAGDKEGAFGNDSYRLGNHIGSYYLDAYYNTDDFSLQAYFRSVFDDGSGRKSENRPDGLYGLYYKNKKNENALIQSALVEFYHTTDQSGNAHGMVDGVKNRGLDNYFNHGEYKSGWTHYGRTFGSPLFITGKIDGQTVVLNNRFKAVHIGVRGMIAGIPYKTYFTYSKNYGTYAIPLVSENSGLNQVSALAEVTLPTKKLPFRIDVACAVDKGELLKDNVGMYVRVYRRF